MTKAECIHAFFSSFGLPAYEENSVPDYLDDEQTIENHPPYITYELLTDDFRGEAVPVTVLIYDYSDSWQMLNEKTEEISKRIGRFLRLICDDGVIAVTKGSPFAQNGTDKDDRTGKYKYINLEFTFVTN